jgi:RimJ/RimL family protein N-acetyltransferase
VVAFTERGNNRSSAVMRRLGMRFEGELVSGGVPFVLYRATRPDRATRPAAEQ